MKTLIADYSAWIVGVAGALAVIATVLGRLRRRGRKAVARWNAGIDTLLGRPAIHHPDTGVVIVAETPGLGSRLATIETTLVSLSDTQTQMGELREQVVKVSATLTSHIAESTEANRARSEEQRAMWNAIQAVAEARPAGTESATTTIHSERSV